jgi:hypothetical protein
VSSAVSVQDVYGYQPGWGHLGRELQEQLVTLMAPQTALTQPQPT